MIGHHLKRWQMVAFALSLSAVNPTCKVVADQPGNNDSPWSAIVAGQQSEPERLATVDLQRYLAQVTGVVPAVIDAEQWKSKPCTAVAVGTPETNVLLRSLRAESEALGEQGYYLARHKVGGVEQIVALGHTPIGAVNAMYGLLRELGYGFYLGSEAVPASLPEGVLAKPIIRKPALATRGVLPWYNFFNSPTTWDPVDHRAFVDQLIRMGANFVGFHTYDHEPFAAYEEGGRMKWGQRLINTGSPTWGTNPLATRDFAFGIDKLFADDFFGAASTKLVGDDNAAIRREQEIMRDALDYAHQRGLKTCLGFELGGDPTNPADHDVFLKRLNHVLDQYPSLDYVWLWQMETQGVQGYRADYNQHILPDRPQPESPLNAYAAVRRQVFRRIVERDRGERAFLDKTEQGKHARAMEGARLEQYAQLAYRALAKRTGSPRLIICGWGGDERLLSAEYYDGLDKLLPDEAIFASLDHIIPRTRVDAIYHKLPAHHLRWPIPWLEYDGDQWHPQPFVHTYEKMVRDVSQGGSQGVLGIHWRTRDVEENFGYLVAYAWDPTLTAEGFFKDLCRRCYDPSIAAEMAGIHSALDKLGYRWLGGAGQVECGPFAWGPGEPAKVVELKALRDRAAALSEKVDRSKPSRAGTARLSWLINNMDWVLQFQEAEVAAVNARDLLGKAKAAGPDQAGQLAGEALALLDGARMAQALRTYATRVSTRGEYGVLATINTKAVVAWRNLRQECRKTLGHADTPEPQVAWTTPPQISLPRLLASVSEREEMELMPIVFGGQPAWLHYRRLGDQQWTSQPMETVRGWVQRAVIPAAAVTQPGLEYGFSFSRTPEHSMAFGPVAVTVMPKLIVNTTPAPIRQATSADPIALAIEEHETAPVTLRWSDIATADYFRVYRDDQPISDTSVAFFPDAPLQPAATYKVEAWRDNRVIAASEPVQCTVPDHPIDETVELNVRTSRTAVVLRWPDVKSPHVIRYRVRRFSLAGEEKGSGSFSRNGPQGASQKMNLTPFLLGEILVTGPGLGVQQDPPLAGIWIYKVLAVNAAGREFEIAHTKPINVPPASAAGTRPALDLPLTTQPAGAGVFGDVRFDASGATFTGGHISLPATSAMNLDQPMTLTFEFQTHNVEGMPVLLCHGLHAVDGWFVQILGGTLILRTTAGDAVGPRIEPNKWYAVRFVFDGLYFHLAVNGQWQPQPLREMVTKPAERSLLIGNYEQDGPPYAFWGTIRNVRIYPDTLME